MNYHTYSPQETKNNLYCLRTGQGTLEIVKSGGLFRDILRDTTVTITPETGSTLIMIH